MTDAEKREKIIKGLECCEKKVCIFKDTEKECPYWELCGKYEDAFEDCTTALAKDALALLKAQEPRVMKVGEVRNWVNSDRVTREPIVIEIRGGVCAWIIDDEVRELPGEENLSSDLYGKTWRCWTSRPTEEQMGVTPWN